MNHKWQNNICVRCGLSREKKEYKKPGLPYSVLGRDGCWYDRTPYTYGIGYWYGKKHGFNRPDCPIELQNDAECDTSKADSSTTADNQNNKLK